MRAVSTARHDGAVSIKERLAGGAWATIRKVVGWILVVLGIAGLVLPGPGLLPLVAGLAILGQHYHWAHRLLSPVRHTAWRAAAEGVLSTWRLMVSISSAVFMAALGTVWIIQPDVPSWWPLRDDWWLFGGWVVGVGIIVSAIFALVLLAYSHRAVMRARRGGPPVPGVTPVHEKSSMPDPHPDVAPDREDLAHGEQAQSRYRK